MGKAVLTSELVRRLLNQPPTTGRDFRDPTKPGLVLRARPSGVHTWRARTADHRWVTLGRLEELSIGKAQEACLRLRAQATLGERIITRKSSGAMLLGQFLDEIYEPWMRATYSPKTEQVTRLRSAFAEVLHFPLGELTTATIERWRAQRRSHRALAEGQREPAAVKRGTLHRNLGALKAALGRAVEWGYLSEHPMPRLKRAKEDAIGVVRYLTPEEEQRLRSALAERDRRRFEARESANAWREERGYPVWPSYGEFTDHLRPLVLLALNTGLRRGELLNLRWRDVDLHRAFLTVSGDHSKSGQTRHIPLNSEVLKLLEAWKADDVRPGDVVFPGADDETPLKDVKKGWLPLLRVAKVRSFRFHDLRHTFASKLVMAGVDLNTVRELLGHADIKMTLRYAHLAPAHKAAAVERLVPSQ